MKIIWSYKQFPFDYESKITRFGSQAIKSTVKTIIFLQNERKIKSCSLSLLGVYPDGKNYNRSDVQLSERLASLGNQRGSIGGLLKLLRSSQHYRINRGPHFGPHLSERRHSLMFSQSRRLCKLLIQINAGFVERRGRAGQNVSCCLKTGVSRPNGGPIQGTP